MKTTFFILILVFYFLLETKIAAQIPVFERITNISLTSSGSLKPLAFLGGLNNPQFSEADLNNDGLNDLFIFDRAGNVSSCLINKATQVNTTNYELDLQFLVNFPPLQSWVLLRDYNCDNIPDIFTYYNNGCRVFKGYYNADNRLSFSLISNELTFNGNNGIVIAMFDIPAIADVNFDGDLDILTFNTSGGFIEYYENTSMENTLTCNELTYTLSTSCWGQVYEPGITNVLQLDTICLAGFGKNTTFNSTTNGLHVGSSLCDLDFDADKDLELVIGDISFSNLVQTTNGGSSAFSYITEQDINFPSYNIPASVENFPAAFKVDANNDHLPDILVSPNREESATAQQNYNCVWYYKNIGTANNYKFELQSDTFLVSLGFDVNRESKPVFFDYNNDNLIDIVVGNYGYFESANSYHPALALLKNVGTQNQPAFELVSKNFMNIENQLTTGVLAYKPTFGDLDNDGDKDMIIGASDGFIHYFTNNPINNEANFILTEERYKNLDAGQNSTPQLIDVNKDGLLDLIIGKHTGIIQYWQNTGTLTNAEFTQINAFWGEIDVKQPGEVTGNAYPNLVDYNGKWLLLVGAENGKLHLYNNIEAHLSTGKFDSLSTNLISTPIGSRLAPAIYDINNDGLFELVCGNTRGGLVWYQHLFNVGENVPNTNQSNIKKHLRSNLVANTLYFDNLSNFLINPTIEIYDLCGQLLQKNILENKQNSCKIFINYPNGLYICKYFSNNITYSEKFVVQH